jgi:hypothetical protein
MRLPRFGNAHLVTEVVGGRTYRRADTDRDTELWEVNWSDLQRPKLTSPGLALHWLKLAVAMLTVAPGIPAETHRSTRYVLRMATFVLALTAPWSLLLALGSMMASSSASLLIQWAITLLTAGAMAAAAWTFGRLYTGLRAGYVWAFGMIALGALSTFDPDTNGRVGGTLYLLSQYLVALSLLSCGATTVLATVRQRGSHPLHLLASFMLTLCPMIILMIIGAVAWLLALLMVTSYTGVFVPGRLDAWIGAYGRLIPYDLRTAEGYFTLAFVSIGALGVGLACVAGAAECRWRLAIPGNTTRDLVVGFLVVAVMILALATAGILPTSTRVTLNGGELLGIYSFSSLRVLPAVVGLFARPLTIAGDVVGDVVFYLAGPRFGVRSEAVGRLLGVMNHLGQRRDLHEVILVGVSQGSVLVADALLQSPSGTYQVLTGGSPLHSLYRRFLGKGPDILGDGPVTWRNAFRRGDYIGGEIRGDTVANIDIGVGGHTDYWSDESFWGQLDLLGARPAAIA